MNDQILRAIRQGIDSARNHGKLAPAPYHQNHWLFQAWWQALVAKADWPDWSDRRVIEHVQPRIKWRNVQ